MNILLVSNEDICRTRIAEELLASFGRGMKISAAGIAEGSEVPEVVCDVMRQKGYNISRKKPTNLSKYLSQSWDFVLALSKEAEEELKVLQIRTEHMECLIFDDAFDYLNLSVCEQENKVSEVYDDMYKRLYEFYRDVLSEMLMPRCTCGANNYCRCE